MLNETLVVALDFGTTYSGYAISFNHDFQEDPFKINCTNHFHTLSGTRMSLKIPTCIPFSPDQQFHSFGYEEEEKCSDLLMDGEHQAWYYFKNFKMILDRCLAGITRQNLSIALEHEAASFFCRHLPVEKLSDSDKSEISCCEPGKRFLVIDAGGGTLDITVHEVLDNGHLREPFKANGGPWGGTTVDGAFKEFLKSLLGHEILARFERYFIDDYMDLCREFELKKRTFSPELDQKVTLKIPTMLHEAFQDDHGKSFWEVVAERQDLQEKHVFAGDKMRFGPRLMSSISEKIYNEIKSHIMDLYNKSELFNNIIMVGGFSESPLISNVIQTNFCNMRVVFPNEASLAVLKGAVLFGHQPKIVSSRVSRYTYRISVREPAQNGGPKELLIQEEDCSWTCRDHFSKHMEVEEEFPFNVLCETMVCIPSDKINKVNGGMKIVIYAGVKLDFNFRENDFSFWSEQREVGAKQVKVGVKQGEARPQQ